MLTKIQALWHFANLFSPNNPKQWDKFDDHETYDDPPIFNEEPVVTIHRPIKNQLDEIVVYKPIWCSNISSISLCWKEYIFVEDGAGFKVDVLDFHDILLAKQIKNWISITTKLLKIIIVLSSCQNCFEGSKIILADKDP